VRVFPSTDARIERDIHTIHAVETQQALMALQRLVAVVAVEMSAAMRGRSHADLVDLGRAMDRLIAIIRRVEERGAHVLHQASVIGCPACEVATYSRS